MREGHGNLLESPTEALVNTVNTVGIMGKGIALQFKRAYPAMFKAYEAACKRGEVEIGRMHVWHTGSLTGPRYIINFPTKRHWKARSRLDDIRAGLVDLTRVLAEHRIESVAVPPLGCGNGGLDWNDVAPLIRRAFEALPEVDVLVFPPAGAPTADEMVTGTERPRLTLGKAALVTLIADYGDRALEVSLVEVQKLMYFLQVAGEPLRLNYAKGRYGPYADNLRHSLIASEGHFLTGFGDGSRQVPVTEPLRPPPGAAAEAAAVLAEYPDTRERIERVLDLADGFETAYSMELLATVHWLATHDAPESAEDAQRLGELVREWSSRKRGLFGQRHVEIAWERLRRDAWI
ncbi:MAG: macro domain-containing protein [Acidimicrobiales bacterium]